MQTTAGDSRISIVVAVYNGEAYLKEALQSALAQTRPAAEIIVVDDGSTDRSAEIARDCGVTVIQQANAGLSAARNTGLQASTGDYLVFLDDDDRLLPDTLAINAAHLDADQSLGFVGGRSTIIRADGTRTGDIKGADSSVPCSYRTLLEGAAFVPPSSVMFRRKAVLDIDGFDPALRSGNEDLDVYLKVARHWPVLRHDEVLVEYRRHDNNLSSNSLGLLSSVHSLLEAQRPHCADDPTLLAAIEHGKRNWVAIYGPGLVGKAVGDLRRGKTRRALQGFALALRLYPQGFYRYAAHKLGKAS